MPWVHCVISLCFWNVHMQALAFILMRKQRLTSTSCITIIAIRLLCPCPTKGKYINSDKSREQVFSWYKSVQCCWSQQAVLSCTHWKSAPMHFGHWSLSFPPACISVVTWSGRPRGCSTSAGSLWQMMVREDALPMHKGVLVLPPWGEDTQVAQSYSCQQGN